MTTRILIIAHAPLASALREAVLHVYPDAGDRVLAQDVLAQESIEETIERAKHLLNSCNENSVLVLTDVFGATPCNVAQKIVDGDRCKLISGVNLPMLWRTVNYLHEPLEILVSRAIAGGTQSIMQVSVTAPQIQQRKKHDFNSHDHNQ